MSGAAYLAVIARIMLPVSAVVLVCAPAVAQQLGGGSETELPLWRVAAALALCLLLAAGAAVALRARMRAGLSMPGSGSRRRLALIETLRLGHQIDLCLVRCDERELLVLLHPQGPRFAPLAPDGQAAPAVAPGSGEQA